MVKEKFIKSLIVLNIGLIIVLVGLHLIPAFVEYKDLSIYLLIFFIIQSIIVYSIGQRAVHSKNIYTYNNIIILNFAMKLFISFIILAIYYKIKQPQDHYFVIPFAIIYLAYTIYETYFMVLQSNPKNR